MRFALILLLATGCVYPDMDVSPPEQPDKVAELQNRDATHPSLRPATWMIGCYEITVPHTVHPARGEIFRFRLTAKPIKASDGERVHQYRFISMSAAGDRYRWRVWKPVSEKELEVEFNTGFEAAVFHVQKEPSGLSATAEFSSDATFHERKSDSADIRVIPCPEETP